MSTPTKLPGTPIGVPGSWSNQGNVIANAFDGSYDTFVDTQDPAGYVGMDLGAPKVLSSIQYAPRHVFAPRMVGGKFMASNNADRSAAVTLATITVAPPYLVMTTVAVSGTYRYVWYQGPVGGHANLSQMQVWGTASVLATPPPVPPVIPPPVNPPVPPVQPPVAGRPTFNIDPVHGLDTNDGSADKPLKTIRIQDHSTVILAPVTYTSTIDLDNHTDIIIGAVDPAHPAIFDISGAAVRGTGASKITLQNMTLQSTAAIETSDGVSIAKSIDISLLNINVQNLYDGMVLQSITGLTITNLNQTGRMIGRCLYASGCINVVRTGGKIGPSEKQSPERWSSPKSQNVKISNIYGTQKGSPFPIAVFAGHSIINSTIDDYTAEDGEFAFQSAGVGLGDVVDQVICTNIKTRGTKFHVGDVVGVLTVSKSDLQNPTGETISVQCPATATPTFTDMDLTTPKHAVHMYAPCAKFKLSGSRIHGPGPIVDGSTSPGNDDGTNKLVAA